MAKTHVRRKIKLAVVLLLVASPFLFYSLGIDSLNATKCNAACLKSGFHDSWFRSDKNKFIDPVGHCYCQAEGGAKNESRLTGHEITFK